MRQYGASLRLSLGSGSCPLILAWHLGLLCCLCSVPGCSRPLWLLAVNSFQTYWTLACLCIFGSSVSVTLHCVCAGFRLVPVWCLCCWLASAAGLVLASVWVPFRFPVLSVSVSCSFSARACNCLYSMASSISGTLVKHTYK